MGFGGVTLPGGSSIPTGDVGDIFTYTAEGAVWANPEELELGGSGSGLSVLTGNFSGPLAVFASTSRWYPPKTVSITKAWASVGETSEHLISFDVKKNGVSILQVPIASNQNRSVDVELDPAVQLLSSDYLTFAITAASGGRNASVFVEYN